MIKGSSLGSDPVLQVQAGSVTFCVDFGPHWAPDLDLCKTPLPVAPGDLWNWSPNSSGALQGQPRTYLESNKFRSAVRRQRIYNCVKILKWHECAFFCNSRLLSRLSTERVCNIPSDCFISWINPLNARQILVNSCYLFNCLLFLSFRSILSDIFLNVVSICRLLTWVRTWWCLMSSP